MKNDIFYLWFQNKKGLLSLEEKEIYSLELEACDYIMQIQIPTWMFLKVCGGYQHLTFLLSSTDKILELATFFNVSSNAIYFKILYLIFKKKKRKNAHEIIQARVLKKEGNIIYLK